MNKSLQERCTILPRRLIKDERGWFVKAITGTEEGLPNHTGEVYFTCAAPGQTKGKHYHPKAQEWFTLITGKAILKLIDICTLENLEIKLDANKPVTVYIPNNVAHSVVNKFDSDFILCAYTDLLYDPKDTIAYEL